MHFNKEKNSHVVSLTFFLFICLLKKNRSYVYKRRHIQLLLFHISVYYICNIQ